MHLQTLRKRLSQLDRPEAAGDTIDEVVGGLSNSIAGMRDLIFELRPTTIDHDGLVPALRQLVDHLVPDVARSVEDRLEREPPSETRIILYRIAQEALMNMRKHAHAATVEVSLDERDGGYALRIRDDGVGFSPPPALQSSAGHLGLSSMRERAEMARGTCRVESAPGEGTTVEVWLPGEPEEDLRTTAVGGGGRAMGAAAVRTPALRLVNGAGEG
jgi:signal transduction histidine kinase